MTVVGVDVGGTSTTAVAVAPDGASIEVNGPGANLRSSSDSLERVLTDCFTELARRGVRPSAGCIGVAGSDAAMDVVTAAANAAWRAAGWGGTLIVETDLTIAFRAGAERDGLLLLSGTGAGAALFADGACVSRADGMGWLLGDIGSAVWLGTRALQAVAADLDRRGPATALTQPVFDRVAGPSPATDDPRRALVAGTYALQPAAYGRFAPLVVEAAEAGDAVAQAIVTKAVDGLLNTAHAAARDVRPQSVGLAGSVLAAHSTLAQQVEQRVREEFGVVPVIVTRPVVGALRIASESLSPETIPRG